MLNVCPGSFNMQGEQLKSVTVIELAFRTAQFGR